MSTEQVEAWHETMLWFRTHAADHMPVGALDQNVAAMKDGVAEYGVNLEEPNEARAFLLGCRHGEFMGASVPEERRPGMWHMLACFYPDEGEVTP